MGTSVEKKSVIRMLQHSILQLCNEHVGYSNKLQILGVLCMTVDDEPQELVIKVNNTLKRVGPNNCGKEVTQHSAPPPQPVIPVPQPITISPIPSSGVSQNLTQHFQQAEFFKNRNTLITSSVPSTQITGVPFNTQAGSLVAQSAITPISLPNKDGMFEDSATDKGETSMEKKSHSQGRKGRKPTKVHHVYDEGELISQGDDLNDDVLTVIPTDPDHPEEEMEPIQIVPQQEKLLPPPPPPYMDMTAVSQSSNQPPNLSIMRQVLEQGAAAAMAAARRKQSPYRSSPYGRIPSVSTPNKPSGSASIRALLQAQAQMRQQMRMAQVFGSPIKHNPHQNALLESPSRSQNSSPTAPGTIIPITVAPESPQDENNRENNAGDEENEQEEALDFSKTDKNMNDCIEGDLVIDDRPLSIEHVRNRSTSCTPNEYSVLKVKHEPNEMMENDEDSHLTDNGDLSQAVAHDGSNLTSTPINYHNPIISPFAGYTLLDGLSHPAYSAMNLSLASGLNMSNGTGSPDTSGLSIQYTATGPITVGANGQNVSNSPRVKDMVLYDDQSPLKLQKGNKVIQEGDFMLDKLGLDPKRRRRRSPDETLTAEEIAEYMGATNLGTNTGPHSVLFKCKYCNEEMEDLVRYLQHTLTVHNAYICHQCGKSFTTKSSLLRHRPIHTGLRRFACSICKKTFYRKDKCKSHIKRHLGPGDQNVDQYQQIEPVPEMPE